MFLAIIFISIIIGILFLVVLISLIIFIYNKIKENIDAKNKSLKILIPSAVVWVLLIIVNVFLIITYLYKNSDTIIDKSLRKSSEIISQGLVLTAQNFEKNWDKNRLSQLEKLTISSSTTSFEKKDGAKIYNIELIFDNNSPADIKLYLDDLIGNNYLVACDKDDFVYLLKLKERTNEKIPFGKSKFKFTVNVPENVEITHVRFVYENIILENQ